MPGHDYGLTLLRSALQSARHNRFVLNARTHNRSNFLSRLSGSRVKAAHA